jgi:N-acetylmuramoyl-L-alanine amidase
MCLDEKGATGRQTAELCRLRQPCAGARGRPAGLAAAITAWLRAQTAIVVALMMAMIGPARATDSTVSRMTVTGNPGQTQVTMELSAGVSVQAFTLANPYRVVVDMPDVTFQIDSRGEPAAAGLVETIRYGTFGPNRSRVVMATTGPVQIGKAAMVRTGTGFKLDLTLNAIDASAFAASQSAARPSPAPSVKPAVFEDTPSPAPPKAKPVVMIDPGHGGIDPGAVGPGRLTEKSIVLAVAGQLQALLVASGRYDAVLTRTGDTFIALDRRVELSRLAGADIFISLHADAIDDSSLARSIRGASVYTLSDRASDEQAQTMAEKENAADIMAGLEPSAHDRNDEVKSILFDLIARETATFSHLLSRSIVHTLGKTGGLTREPLRAAAFRVLKQSHAPAVLIELGFLSNPSDAQQLASPVWQKQTAAALASAIDSYFQRKNSGSASGAVSMGLGGVTP